MTKEKQKALEAAYNDAIMTKSTNLPELTPMIRYIDRREDKPCIHKGELMLIQALQKSGKSAFAALLAQLFLDGGQINGHDCSFNFEKVNRIRVIDTEQNKHKVKSDLIKMSGNYNENTICSFCLLANGTDVQALDLIEYIAERDKPDVIILDQIGDLVDNVNDIKETKKVLKKLLSLAEKLDILIVCCLHFNPYNSQFIDIFQAKGQGYLGSEIVRKIALGFRLQKETINNEELFRVYISSSECRHIGFNSMEHAFQMKYDYTLKKHVFDNVIISKIPETFANIQATPFEEIKEEKYASLKPNERLHINEYFIKALNNVGHSELDTTFTNVKSALHRIMKQAISYTYFCEIVDSMEKEEFITVEKQGTSKIIKKASFLSSYNALV